MRSIAIDTASRPRARWGSLGQVLLVAVLGTAVAFGSAHLTPSRASAQCTMAAPCVTQVHPDGKGMIAMALFGAELGLFIPALVQNAMHTNEWWPYLVFPLVGIAAGIGGGYGIEQATQRQPEVDVGLLIGAGVLIVPTVIATLALATYSPSGESIAADEDMDYEESEEGDSVEAVQDSSSSSASPDSSSSGSSDSSSSSSSGGTSRRETAPSTDMLAGGTGLVRFDTTGSRVLLGVPVLGAVARYTSEELASLHLTQQYDVNLPIVSGSF